MLLYHGINPIYKLISVLMPQTTTNLEGMNILTLIMTLRLKLRFVKLIIYRAEVISYDEN